MHAIPERAEEYSKMTGRELVKAQNVCFPLSSINILSLTIQSYGGGGAGSADAFQNKDQFCHFKQKHASCGHKGKKPAFIQHRS